MAFIGAYATVRDFKLSKWSYRNTGCCQDVRGCGFGAIPGFQVKPNKRRSPDAYIGGGRRHGEYEGFYKDTGERYIGWNGSGERMPYRAGITICYFFGKNPGEL
jgi:hypothetical protein